MKAILLAALLAGGCYGEATYTATATPVGVYGPDLVYVAPGVQVVADFDYPVFFVDGIYWRYYNNGWYRSSYYNGGWAWASPPPSLLRIPHPHTYAHYRPRGYVPHRGPIVRDHRNEGRGRYNPYGPRR